MNGEQTYTYTGVTTAGPVILDAENFLIATAYPSEGIQSINILTGEVNWTFATALVQGTPAISNGTIYVGSTNGTLYAVDPTKGTQLWSFQVASRLDVGPVFDPVSGLLFTGNNNGEFYAVDPVSQAIKWQFQFPNSVAEETFLRPAVIVDGIVFAASGINASSVTNSGYLCAFEAATGVNQWTSSLGSGVCAPLAAGDGLIFLSCYDQTVRAIEQTSGSELWRFQMENVTVGQGGYHNGWVYFGSTDTNFYAHASRPQPQAPPSEVSWKLSLGANVRTDIVIGGGNAYFVAANASENNNLYVLNLAQAQNGNPQALTGAFGGWPNSLSPIAFNQIAFSSLSLSDSGNVNEFYMIDLEILDSANVVTQAVPPPAPSASLDSAAAVGMQQMASFNSQLIVDTYDVSGATAAPTTPAFQMTLSLFDENNAPQTSSKVSIWASEPITLIAGGQSYSIGTDSTNPTVLPASSAGQLAMSSSGSIGTANLFLQPDFFLQGFYLTVFPDYGNFQRLTNLQASDLDPATALGYDSQPILLSNYQDLDSRTSIASAISNTVGQQLQQPVPTAVASLTADPPSRSYQPGAVPNFTIDFSSGITFSPSDSAPAVKGLADDFLGFDDFINNIVNGAEKIGKIVWQFANGVATAIINGLENAYQFVVQTVDQAIQVATGIFKQVVSDISKVVEWLSYLFSWDDIVNTHTLIKTQLLTTITGFQTWIDGELKQTTNDVDTFFNNAEQNALSLFDQLITKLGGQTVDGVRKIGGDPGAAFSAQGQDVTTQANWLPRKLSENAGGASLSSLAAAATGDSTPASAIETFFTTVGQQITSDPALQSLPADAKTALTNFSNLFTGSAGFSGQTLADVLAVVRDLVAGLIHLGKVVVDAFLTLLQNIIDAIVNFLTGPIQVPFLSDFYQLIAGDQLSVLSLFSLIAAVPTTIVYKLLTGTAPAGNSTAAPTAKQWLGLANTFTLLLLLPLWIAADLAEFPPVINGAIAAATAVQSGLVLALMAMASSSSPDYILWTLQFFSVILAMVGVWGGGPAWSAAAPTIYGCYGFGMMIIYIMYASNDPKNYFDPDGEVFFNNVCSALPYLGQPLALIQVADLGPAAVALVDAVGYGTSAALSTILFWSAG